MEQATENVGAALDGFSRRLGQGELKDVVVVKNVVSLDREMKRFTELEIQRHLAATSKSVQPLKQWTQDFGGRRC